MSPAASRHHVPRTAIREPPPCTDARCRRPAPPRYATPPVRASLHFRLFPAPTVPAEPRSTRAHVPGGHGVGRRSHPWLPLHLRLRCAASAAGDPYPPPVVAPRSPCPKFRTRAADGAPENRTAAATATLPPDPGRAPLPVVPPATADRRNSSAALEDRGGIERVEYVETQASSFGTATRAEQQPPTVPPHG